MRAAGTVLADPIWSFSGDTSLMHGWVPAAIQVLAAVTLVVAVGWRSRRWRLLRVPAAAVFGIALAWLTHWNITSEGLAGDPPSPTVGVDRPDRTGSRRRRPRLAVGALVAPRRVAGDGSAVCGGRPG